jgi:flavodoxin
MKNFIFLVLAFLILISIPNVMAQSNPAQKKILIAYFSKTGNTQKIAEDIQKNLADKNTRVDIFKIETVKPYPESYQKTVDIARKELADNARPAIKNKVANFADYDVVFLGFPIWCGTLPMALFTFLESYDFAGKTIIPFSTSGSSGIANSVSDIKKLAPNAKILNGLAVRAANADNSQTAVSNWLKQLKY